MTLIPNWRQAWRYHTVIGAFLLGALNFATAHSVELSAALPPGAMSAINRWGPLALIVLRLIQQPAIATSPEAPAPSKESS